MKRLLKNYQKDYKKDQQKDYQLSQGQRWREMPDAVVENYDSADSRNIKIFKTFLIFWAITFGKACPATLIVHKFEL